MTQHSGARPRVLPDFLGAGPAAAAPAPVARATGSARPGHVPGEAGLWVFLLGDMTLFGFFFVGYTVAARSDPELFAAAAGALHPPLGAVNTVVLLVGSALVAAAVGPSGASRPGGGSSARLLGGAGLLGLVFVGVKVWEYADLVGHGHLPTSNLFFTYYFTLTGIHLLHVLFGVTALAIAAAGVRAGRLRAPFVEGVAAYWHMVDLLWVVLFPLLYVLPEV